MSRRGARGGGRGRAARLLPVAASVVLGLGLLPACLSAQLPYTEPPPWSALDLPSTRRAVSFDAARYDDERAGWTAHRFALTVLLPQGSASCLFVRVPWFSLDTGGRSAPARWPDIVGPKAPAGWPGGERDVGWGSPELGVLSGLALPGAGSVQYSLAVGLPVGRDVLYPFASTNLPVWLRLRKPWRVGAAWSASLLAGRTWNLGSGRDVLASAAFPGAYAAALGLSRGVHERRALSLDLAMAWGGSRRLMTAGLAWRLPVGATDVFTISADRELLGRGDRPFATRIAVAWTFCGLTESKPAVAK